MVGVSAESMLDLGDLVQPVRPTVQPAPLATHIAEHAAVVVGVDPIHAARAGKPAERIAARAVDPRGPDVQRQPEAAVGVNPAAHAFAGFDHCHLVAGLAQRLRGAEAGKACADDGDLSAPQPVGGETLGGIPAGLQGAVDRRRAVAIGRFTGEIELVADRVTQRQPVAGPGALGNVGVGTQRPGIGPPAGENHPFQPGRGGRGWCCKPGAGQGSGDGAQSCCRHASAQQAPTTQLAQMPPPRRGCPRG
ncbi:MAG: Uncharacterised protein [Rhodospirillaceae bacterium]|nr:MAG: Uncharacterised protein [Rhodospirillaceae bacterium]